MMESKRIKEEDKQSKRDWDNDNTNKEERNSSSSSSSRKIQSKFSLTHWKRECRIVVE